MDSISRSIKQAPKKLTPELLVNDGDNFEKLTEDQKIQAAIKWIKKTSI